MQRDTSVAAIAHVIQLSVAPVFLVSGIGAMLSVMTNRLARVVDRARVLEREVEDVGVAHGDVVGNELGALARRAKLIGASIALCTITALLICAVIGVLFVGSVLDVDMSRVIALLFVGAMAAFFIGLVQFLREIRIATKTVRIGLAAVPKPPR